MKLEKDRLKARVENLESNLSQIKNDGQPPDGKTVQNEPSRFDIDLQGSPTKT